MIIPQSVKLLLARTEADTDGSGVADAVLKVPGTFGVNPDGSLVKVRTIEGGFGCLTTQEPGDYLTIELRDDDDLLGFGAGAVLDEFHDTDVAASNQGWYFMGSNVLDLHPIVSDDPTELPAGMYLHVVAHKKTTPTPAHTFYVNIHWGFRIR